MAIEGRGIGLNIGGARILDGIDIAIRPGELVGIIGPNGAGKTSLLRTLAMLAEPGDGLVAYDGRDARGMPSEERARYAAYLAQSDAVHWPMRVEKIVALGRLPHRGRAGAEADREAVERALAAADIVMFRDRTIDTLSGGERARVLLARALAVEAPVLLADEPTAALDPYHQLQIMELLQANARAGAAVAVVLHDLVVTVRFCDRVVLLDGGRKIADGPPDEVLTDGNIASAYGVEVRRGEGYVLPWRRLEENGRR